METQRKFFAVSGITGTVAAIIFVVLGWHFYSARKANEALRVRTEQVLRETAVLQKQRDDLERFFAQPENAKLEERSAFLNTLIDKQSLNWTKMFMDLERILPAGVHVLTIAPRYEAGGVRVKLTAGAVNEQAKLKFIKALEDSPAFRHVRLEGQRSSSQQQVASMDRMVLELTAEYARS
jgi:Tfp pilus assembly protein PilN